MVSTFTTSNRFERPGRGDYVDDWANFFEDFTDTLDQSLDGVQTVTVSSTVDLTTVDGASDQARNRVLVLTGTGGTLQIPAVKKVYRIVNNCTGNVIVDPDGAGTTVTLYQNFEGVVVCDGTDVTRGRSNRWLIITQASPMTGTSRGITFDTDNFTEWTVLFDAKNDTAGSLPFRLAFAATDGTYATSPSSVASIPASSSARVLLSISSFRTSFSSSGTFIGQAKGSYMTGANPSTAPSGTNSGSITLPYIRNGVYELRLLADIGGSASFGAASDYTVYAR